MKTEKLCPYACNVVQVNQDSYTYNEYGRNTFHEHILNETKNFVPCQEERCGAWHDGRCRYCGE